jgi:hypothetical protein
LSHNDIGSNENHENRTKNLQYLLEAFEGNREENGNQTIMNLNLSQNSIQLEYITDFVVVIKMIY